MPKTKWAVRCWWWPDPVPEEPDPDDAEQQWRDVPSPALAHYWGKKMAANERATSPGLYDVMRRVRDDEEVDGYRWEVAEEVRP